MLSGQCIDMNLIQLGKLDDMTIRENIIMPFVAVDHSRTRFLDCP